MPPSIRTTVHSTLNGQKRDSRNAHPVFRLAVRSSASSAESGGVKVKSRPSLPAAGLCSSTTSQITAPNGSLGESAGSKEVLINSPGSLSGVGLRTVSSSRPRLEPRIHSPKHTVQCLVGQIRAINLTAYSIRGTQISSFPTGPQIAPHTESPMSFMQRSTRRVMPYNVCAWTLWQSTVLYCTVHTYSTKYSYQMISL